MSSSSDNRISRRFAVQGFAGLAFGLVAAPHLGLAQATPPAATPVSNRFPVTLTHAMGDTAINERPARVVAATDFVDLDYLLTLGIEPVLYGFSNAWESGAMPWQSAAANIPTFDASADLDLEAIAAARPDLIVTMPMYVDSWYETLSAIAPTIVLDWSTPWRDGLRLVARATGEEQVAEEQIALADALIAEATADLQPAAGMPMMVGFQYGDAFYIWGDESGGGALFLELGLDFVSGADPILQQTSLEQVSLLAHAEILLSVDSDPAGIALQEASPLFQSLPAVQRGGYGVLSVVQSRALADGASPLSLAWVLPDFVALLLQLANGEGTSLP